MAPPPSSWCLIRLQRCNPALEHELLNGEHLRAGTVLHPGSLAPSPGPSLGRSSATLHDPRDGLGGLLPPAYCISCPSTLSPSLPTPRFPLLVLSLSLLCFPSSSPSVSLAGRAFRTTPVARRETVTSRVRWLSRAWGGKCRHRWGSSGKPCPHASSRQLSGFLPLPQEPFLCH